MAWTPRSPAVSREQSRDGRKVSLGGHPGGLVVSISSEEAAEAHAPMATSGEGSGRLGSPLVPLSQPFVTARAKGTETAQNFQDILFW